jgi:O-antigen/teichoic acid export membrane protein
LTVLGGFMVQRSAIVIGSLFLPLKDIASYGITMQLIGVIAGLAGIYTSTYSPMIAQHRVVHNKKAIKELYLKGQLVLLLTFMAGGAALLILGGWGLNFIGSKTHLIPNMMILVATIILFLENNHAIAGGILLSKNEVPFFKASILSGSASIFVLLIFLNFTNIGVWAMILAPGIAQASYQNWKWPMVVFKDLEIKWIDILNLKSAIKHKLRIG